MKDPKGRNADRPPDLLACMRGWEKENLIGTRAREKSTHIHTKTYRKIFGASPSSRKHFPQLV
jgi:hypothetical protein